LPIWRTLQRAPQLRIWPIENKGFRASIGVGVQNGRSREFHGAPDVSTQLEPRNGIVGWPGPQFPLTRFNRPKCARSTVMSPRSGPCSSAPFCTSGAGTSRVFWSYSRAGSKVLITLVTVECSQVRQINRKEEMRGCPATTETYSNRTSYLGFGRYIAVFLPLPPFTVAGTSVNTWRVGRSITHNVGFERSVAPKSATATNQPSGRSGCLHGN